MRVLEVTQRYPPALGGVERHVSQLSRELRAAGAAVEVCTTDLRRDRPFERFRGRIEEGSIPVRRHRAFPILPAPLGLGIAAPGMLFDLLAAEADVVHAHAFGYPPTWFGRFGRGLRGGRLVITAHSDEGRGGFASGAYARFVARGTLAGADGVIALTTPEADRLAALGIERSRIRVIPNGIDLDEFPERSRDGAGSGPVRVLFVGRIFAEQKGLDVLVEAIGLLTDPAAVRVRLVGEEWGSGPALARRARDLGVAGSVAFLGPVPRAQLLEEYRTADLLVLPSRFEPFGIVLLEAMASGLPVVASRVGGIPTVVRENESGLLVRPGDPEALAAALQRLVDDPAGRERMGAAGRALVPPYDWKRLGPQVLGFFREITGSA